MKDDITDLKTPVPVDAIEPTIGPFDIISPGVAVGIKTVIQIAATKSVAKIGAIKLAREKIKRDVSWVLGSKKSDVKWSNQMKDRNWTDEKITETLKFGEKHPAPNDVNKGNEALRYEYKETYLVRDEKTKEIIHLGDKNFKRPIKR